MKVNNKVRAGDYEREICRKLSEWWLGRTVGKDLVFWRTQSSGGRATNRAKAGKETNLAHCGDIYAMDPIGSPLVCLITWETKLGARDASLHQLLDHPKDAAVQTYQQWIVQAEMASHNARTPYWAIVHHKSRRVDVMTMPLSLWQFLGCSDATIKGPILRLSSPRQWNGVAPVDVVSVHFDEFLKGVTPTEIRTLWGAMRRPT